MTRNLPPIPSDPGLPGAPGLFQEEGVRTVGRFLGDRGWTVRDAHPVQAIYHPGRSLIVRYRVAAEGAPGRRALTVCVETRARERRAGSVPSGFAERHGIVEPVDRADGRLVWAYPYDPSLPGMVRAAWGPDMRDALAASDGRPAAVAVEPLRYRPRRRAVFRYRPLHLDRRGRRWSTSFGKVMPGDKVARIRDAAPALRAVERRLPLALPSAMAGTDVMVFPMLPGRSLRDIMVRGGSLPSPGRVADLPSTLASTVAEAGVTLRSERPEAMDLAVPAADLVAQIVPASGAAARRVVDAVAKRAGRDESPASIVHGDLYEAQVFVGNDFSLGLIDLDDLGRGDPAMDAANFCAHLLALALAVPAAADRLVAYRRLVRPAFASALGLSAEGLAWREALCMLLLAAGPFRVLDPAWPMEVGRRVGLAVRLLEER